MKILLLGDYSGCHANLGAGLRRLGHDVTLVSDGCSFMQIAPDVMLARKPGKVGSILYLAQVVQQMNRWRGYDVVQFINPHFLNLRPGKLEWIFRKIKQRNGSLSVTLCSEDITFADALINSETFRYSEAKTGSAPTPFYRSNPGFYEDWLKSEVMDYQHLFYDHCNSLIAVLPEYAMAAERYYPEKVFKGGIAIDLSKHPFSPLEIKDKVRVFLGYKTAMMQRKGTDIMQRVLRELVSEIPDRMELMEAHDIPFNEYLRCMNRAHIVVDQLNAYAPATNALNAMAMGKVVATGGEREYAEWIGTEDPLPLIPLRPTDPDLKEHLRRYILDPERLKTMGVAARRLVEENNEMTIVAQKYIDAWKTSGLMC